MDISTLRSYLEENRDLLEKWGLFVKTSISEALAEKSISMQMASCRVKEVNSAVGKVTRKGYDDPLRQMTDLVGVRFIVLLSPELNVLGDLVETNPAWSYTKDRDPSEETEANAEKFGYQSLHYVVRSKESLCIDGVPIPIGLPCEIQIRTLLQHAYAEVVHDSLYKAVGKVPTVATRYVARSMALIETADHLFCETMKLLENENRVRNQILQDLKNLYASKIGAVDFGADDKLNLLLLEAYKGYISDDTVDLVSVFFDENVPIVTKIRSRLESDPFWSQPSVLLAYWLVNQDSFHAFDLWPFASSLDVLRLVYSDLGISLH